MLAMQSLPCHTILFDSSQDVIKIKLEHDVGITMKRKETSSQLEMAIIHQPASATISSRICSQMHVQKTLYILLQD